MPRFIWDGERLVQVERGPRAPSVFPYVRGDVPEYISPVTGKPVDGRAARREDLKRSGCREVDPSEGLQTGGCYSPTMAARLGMPQVAAPAAPKHVTDWRAGQGVTREAVDAPPIKPFSAT